MREARYRFPERVREATSAMAARMVRDGTVPETPEQLEAWIAAAPDVAASLTAGGYGSKFTAADLLPLLHVFVKNAGGTVPGEVVAAPAPSRVPRVAAMVLALLAIATALWVVFLA